MNERHKAAYELRQGGKSLQEIADALAYKSTGAVHRAITSHERRLGAQGAKMPPRIAQKFELASEIFDGLYANPDGGYRISRQRLFGELNGRAKKAWPRLRWDFLKLLAFYQIGIRRIEDEDCNPLAEGHIGRRNVYLVFGCFPSRAAAIMSTIDKKCVLDYMDTAAALSAKVEEARAEFGVADIHISSRVRGLLQASDQAVAERKRLTAG